MITRRHLGGLIAAGAMGAPPVIGRAAPAVIKVGQTESLTGPSSAYGIRAANGARLAMEQVNKAGGFQIAGTTYTLDIAFNDMANDARQAVTLVRQYASDPGMVATIGPTNSVGF